MANKSNKPNKGLIIGICAAVAAVVVIAVVIILIATGNPKIDDSYFVSDGTKYVLTLGEEDISMDDATYNPLKAHLVYTYSGDQITGLKAYYEYADNTTAKAAYEYMQTINDEGGSLEINDKYVVFIAPAEEYENLTASDVKEQIELMELIRNMDTDDYEEGDYDLDIDIDEDF